MTELEYWMLKINEQMRDINRLLGEIKSDLALINKECEMLEIHLQDTSCPSEQ